MNADNNSTARNGPLGWWADPPRSGMRRIIAPWEYRHLRVFAGLRIASGVVLVLLGVITLVVGGSGAQTYGWALVFLAVAAALFSWAYWLLKIARSLSAQT
jgi:hypothetical protein